MMEKAGGAPTVWRLGAWAAWLRQRLPADWTQEVERAEGGEVAVFRPPAPQPGRLSLLVEERAKNAAGGEPVAMLEEMALRFVRPDDRRLSDRVVERFEDGALRARAVLLASENQDGETHYLWFLGRAGDDRLGAAMLSYALATAHDGREPHVARLAGLDQALAQLAPPPP